MKVVLIILGIAAAVLGSLIGGGYYWFNKNKDEYAALMQEYLLQGKQFGQNKLQSDCKDGLIDNMRACKGLMRCQFASVGFIRGCMTVAGNDNFCEKVPARMELLKSMSWAVANCADKELDDDTCQRYIRGFVEICEHMREEPATKNHNEASSSQPGETQVAPARREQSSSD